MMKIDHIGVACENIEQAQAQYEILGFKVTKALITDFTRNLDYVFMVNNGHRIELISPHDKTQRSDIDSILQNKKVPGNKMYHLCYTTDDIERDIKKLEGASYKLIKPPTPAIACDNNRVAFLINFDLGVVELLEEKN